MEKKKSFQIILELVVIAELFLQVLSHEANQIYQRLGLKIYLS